MNKEQIKQQLETLQQALNNANYKDFDARANKYLQLSQELVVYCEHELTKCVSCKKDMNGKEMLDLYMLYANAIRNVEAWIINLNKQMANLRAQLEENNKDNKN